MCTVATWKDNGVAIVTARNMDWHESMHAKLWYLPAGEDRMGLEGEPNSLNWTSKYSSLVVACYDAAPADGMNEKGLSMHMLWLAESTYPANDHSTNSISISYWGQFYLDSFATVKEAVDYTKANPFNVLGANIPGTDQKVTTHLQINDASGDSAVFEYVDGKINIHHSSEYCVMTNSPTFDKQLENIKQYDGFGGTKLLPGSTEADDRFVRTEYYLKRLQKPKDLRGALAGVISVLRSAAQPYSTPDPKRPNISPTLWRTAMDHNNLAYYFELSDSPFLVWTSFQNLSQFNTASMCDVENEKDLHGDISEKFKASELFKFAPAV